MATSLTHDAGHEDWIEPRATPGGDAMWSPAQWLLWTLFGVALLGAFLFFVVDSYPLRSVIAVQ